MDELAAVPIQTCRPSYATDDQKPSPIDGGPFRYSIHRKMVLRLFESAVFNGTLALGAHGAR